ncbi:MAG: WD40 repeat domain-containing protein [Gammaproteobacteria bacterium]|nr:WD40 repeat domain-containing protein [Gammaproteobacteria bacterium]
MLSKKRFLSPSSTYPDRFIPRRRNGDLGSPLDYPPKTPKTPLAKHIYEALKDPDGDRVLLFSPPKPLTPSFNQTVKAPIDAKFVSSYNRRYAAPLSFSKTRVLDAPTMLDDFYSNTMAWSKENNFVISLGSDENAGFSSTLYNIQNIKASGSDPFSVSQSITTPGVIHAVMPVNETDVVSGWDDGTLKLHTLSTIPEVSSPFIREISTGPSIIYSLIQTSPHTFVCGNRNGELIYVDLRTPLGITAQMKQHEQQIIGLAYDGEHIVASGGNENKVKLWDIRHLDNEPVRTNTTHKAAIKALAFQPNSPRYLISGGGTACRRLCYWDTHTDHVMDTHDTSSQISDVLHLTNPNYLVTSHGFSDASLKLWDVSKRKFSKIAEVSTGKGRTLSIARSPNTDAVATLNSDEAIRFFSVRDMKSEQKKTFEACSSSVFSSSSFTIR